MGPGGDEEGGEKAFAVAEAMLPGVGAPAAVLEQDARDHGTRLLPLKLRVQDVIQYAVLQRMVSGGVRESVRGEAKVVNADTIETLEKVRHVETVQLVHKPGPINLGCMLFYEKSPVQHLTQRQPRRSEMHKCMLIPHDVARRIPVRALEIRARHSADFSRKSLRIIPAV